MFNALDLLGCQIQQKRNQLNQISVALSLKPGHQQDFVVGVFLLVVLLSNENGVVGLSSRQEPLKGFVLQRIKLFLKSHLLKHAATH